MADMVLTSVYDSSKRAFGLFGQDSDRFESDFLDATNMTIGIINTDGDPETDVSRISSTDDTVDNLDAGYTQCLMAGIWQWLLLFGHKPSRGFERQVDHLASQFEHYISMMQNKIRNDATDADTDDEDESVIGLGPLG